MKEFNPQIQRITGVNGIKRVYLPIGFDTNKGGTAESFGPFVDQGLFLLNIVRKAGRARRGSFARETLSC